MSTLAEIASQFYNFLGSQTIGDLDPALSNQTRDAVIASPLDELMATNGFSLDTVLAEKKPKPIISTAVDSSSASEASSGIASDSSSKQDISGILDAINQYSTSVYNTTSSGSNATGSSSSGSSSSGSSSSGSSSSGSSTGGTASSGTSSSITPTIQDNPATFVSPYSNTTVIRHSMQDSSLLLNGTSGSDTIISGGLKGEILEGNPGPDYFVLWPDLLNRSNGLTQILDFSSTEGDHISINKKVLSTVTPSDFVSVSGKRLFQKATLTSTRFIYDQLTGKLYYNANLAKRGLGKKGGLFVTLANKASLTSLHFLTF
jgi:hypothetical protein